MAKGDVVSDLQSVAAGARLDIQPASGVEWIIHNIYHEGPVALEFFNGTNFIEFETRTAGPDWFANFQFHVTNTRRIRVRNTDTAARLIGYDGVQTK